VEVGAFIGEPEEFGAPFEVLTELVAALEAGAATADSPETLRTPAASTASDRLCIPNRRE
jgi:hypothetical protein